MHGIVAYHYAPMNETCGVHRAGAKSCRRLDHVVTLATPKFAHEKIKIKFTQNESNADQSAWLLLLYITHSFHALVAYQ